MDWKKIYKNSSENGAFNSPSTYCLEHFKILLLWCFFFIFPSAYRQHNKIIIIIEGIYFIWDVAKASLYPDSDSWLKLPFWEVPTARRRLNCGQERQWVDQMISKVILGPCKCSEKLLPNRNGNTGFSGDTRQLADSLYVLVFLAGRWEG